MKFLIPGFYFICIMLGCTKQPTFENAFTFYNNLEADQKCIRRVRPDQYKKEEGYEMWVGGKRTAFEKIQRTKYRVMHRERYEKKFMDSIEGVFNKHIETMVYLDILDSCPTYTGKLVIQATSGIIPDPIKNQYLDNPLEVIFIESLRTNIDSSYILWKNDWFFRIVN